jgi:hypothetical protein
VAICAPLLAGEAAVDGDASGVDTAAAVASVAPGDGASEDTLRVVGAVVAGAGPGALQALLFSGFGRRLGNHTMAAPTSSTAITVRAGQYRRRR